MSLMMNAIPVSFRAVGMPTWFGLGEPGLSAGELREVGYMSAVIHVGAPNW